MTDTPDPHPRTQRWARDPTDGRLHALAPKGLTPTPDQPTGCRCGHTLPTDIAPEDHPSGELCLPCVISLVTNPPDLDLPKDPHGPR
ncbi:MAG: hypothetical protein ACRDQG_01940 [Pseudonocardiaceae bacterium]